MIVVVVGVGALGVIACYELFHSPIAPVFTVSPSSCSAILTCSQNDVFFVREKLICHVKPLRLRGFFLFKFPLRAVFIHLLLDKVVSVLFSFVSCCCCCCCCFILSVK